MNILYVTARVPYPPDSGDKIRTYNQLRHLARAHSVYLLSFAGGSEKEDDVSVLRDICREVQIVRVERRRAIARGALAMAMGHASSAGYYDTREMRAAVREVAARVGVDVAWASASMLGPYAMLAPARRRVVDFADVDSEKWREFADHSPFPSRWVFALEARRARRLERGLAEAADLVLFVSEEEATDFRRIAGERARTGVIRNGVDTTFFQPQDGGPPAAPRLLFTGALDYLPNVDAVSVIAREILPLVRKEVPDVRFTAVGHRPIARLLADARRVSGMTVAASVPDVRPYFAAARVYVAPLRFGRGVKNKILEAMAMGVPVVATSTAVSGLRVAADEQVVIASTAAELAQATVALLRDRNRARQLSESALQWVRRFHRWEECLEAADAYLEEVMQPRPICRQ